MHMGQRDYGGKLKCLRSQLGASLASHRLNRGHIFVQVASTIIVAQEDFSIPGAHRNDTDQTEPSTDERQRFFDLLRQSRPDVVVLNLTATKGHGVETIREIRQQSGVPILVVCSSADPLASDYRSAGACRCLHPPVEVIQFNQSIRDVIRQTSATLEPRTRRGEGYRFQGITYRPDQASLAGRAGTPVPLEPIENNVFACLVVNPWAVCSHAQLAECAYHDQSAATQRSVGRILSRLRRKLELAGGPGTGKLVKTEPRRGYALVADTVSFPLPE